jgi:quercetin dioxygenase-like cupin family protein/alkylhydroperoxidase/carboxymuconolactone decarboxylase family protein YurZ
MKRTKVFMRLAMVAFLAGITNSLNAQQATAFDAREKHIVTISAFTAKSDLIALQKALSDGLNAGLSVNEIKEVLVQLYAYTGFPRSLNALNTFMTVLKERKQKGMNDVPGKAPNPLPANKSKLELGTELQTKLIGTPVKGEVYEFAPVIDQFLKEHLFWDIFGRDNLDFRTREIATISALASLGGAENQLRSHFNVGMHNGISVAQLNELVSIIESKVNAGDGRIANDVLQTLVNKGRNASLTTNNTTANKNEESAIIFPKGEKITNNNFKGAAWLQQLVASDSINQVQVGNVTFEPGARTNWHVHPGGQILLVTGGTGYYQEKGSPKKILRKGDVIQCPPNVAHWHGASRDHEFIQIAITNTTKGLTMWQEPVTDEDYSR